MDLCSNIGSTDSFHIGDENCKTNIFESHNGVSSLDNDISRIAPPFFRLIPLIGLSGVAPPLTGASSSEIASSSYSQVDVLPSKHVSSPRSRLSSSPPSSRMSTSPSSSSPSSPTSPASPTPHSSPSSRIFPSNSHSLKSFWNAPKIVQFLLDNEECVSPSGPLENTSNETTHPGDLHSSNVNIQSDNILDDSALHQSSMAMELESKVAAPRITNNAHIQTSPCTFSFSSANEEIHTYQCQIELKSNTYFLADPNNSGVFFLNGKLIGKEPSILTHGDILSIKKRFSRDRSDNSFLQESLESSIQEAFIYQAILLPISNIGLTSLSEVNEDSMFSVWNQSSNVNLIGRKRKRSHTDNFYDSITECNDNGDNSEILMLQSALRTARLEIERNRNTSVALHKLNLYMKETNLVVLQQYQKSMMQITDLSQKNISLSKSVQESRLLLKEQRSKFDDIVSHEITCSICNHIFLEPVTLGCCHSFCKGCLLRLIHSQSENAKSCLCPLCRTYIGTQYPIRNVLMDSFTKQLVPLLDEDLRNHVRNREKEWKDHEADCLSQLQLLLEEASTNATTFLNINEKWSEEAKKIFIRGIRHYIGESRSKYCELVGMTENWIQRASMKQMRIACQNLFLKEPLRYEPGETGVFRLLEEDLRRLLYEYTKNEMYSEEPFLYHPIVEGETTTTSE